MIVLSIIDNWMLLKFIFVCKKCIDKLIDFYVAILMTQILIEWFPLLTRSIRNMLMLMIGGRFIFWSFLLVTCYIIVRILCKNNSNNYRLFKLSITLNFTQHESICCYLELLLSSLCYINWYALTYYFIFKFQLVDSASLSLRGVYDAEIKY